MQNRNLLKKVRQNRSLLKIISFYSLQQLISIRQPDRQMSLVILAEMIHRLWLMPNAPERASWQNSVLQSSQNLLPHSDCMALDKWLQYQQSNRSFKSLELQEKSLANIIEEELINWQNADGSVVFVADGKNKELTQAILFPFIIDNSASPHSAKARTANDNPLRFLEDGIIQANSAAVKFGWLHESESPAITFTTLKTPLSEELGGSSLALPVLLAHALIAKKVSAPVIDLAASGCFQESSNQLCSDKNNASLLKSKAEFYRQCDITKAILPKNLLHPTRQITLWDCHQGLQEEIEQLCNSYKPNADDIRKQIDTIEKSMRYGFMESATARKKLLEYIKILGKPKDLRSKKALCEALFALANAECHLGLPYESSRTLEKALQLQKGKVHFECRMLIRNAVNLQDMEELNKAEELILLAFERLKGIDDDEEQLDLLMQIHGTYAQILACKTLTQPQLLDKTLIQIEKACECAVELEGEDSENHLRDLCYKFMALVLHKPSAPYTEDLFQSLAAQIGTGKSSHYLIRLRWLQFYRQFLAGEKSEWISYQDSLPPKEFEGGWLYALSLKYRATLRSQIGETHGARKDFEEAFNTLGNRGIFNYLRGTVAVQAWRSFKEIDDEYAKGMKAKAEAIFSDENTAATYPRSREWLRFVKGETNSNPQLTYQY